MNSRRLLLTASVALGLLLGEPDRAEAFCGFYVAGADASLFNDATMVVLMRDGKRTVLSMQNDYQGPPEDFALVVPVPVVLRERDVKVLPKDVFDRVDQLASPRLVEYWEQDPCAARRKYNNTRDDKKEDKKDAVKEEAGESSLGVKIEAEFEVGEYQVVVLSAKDSTGLDTWLRQENYNIPAGAEPLLRPYVEGGMKFFVAKVDVEKVEFVSKPDGGQRAMLSPLRFHYDSEEFSLPIRLGLINARGPQDLLVHILAPDLGYEAANYPNVTIPTNLVVNDSTRENFGQFYVSLFDHTLAQHPNAVVTEYAWSANGCDPCPAGQFGLTLEDLIALGADVLPRYAGGFDKRGRLDPDSGMSWTIQREFVLTRLHARYDKSSLGEDLVFQAAPGRTGGRGMPYEGQLDPTVAVTEDWYNFQARYAILHHWQGPARCLRPMWDTWGGPPDRGYVEPAVARQLAFVSRDAELASFMTNSSHQVLQLEGEPPADERKRGCSCSTAEVPGAGIASVLGLFGLLFLRRRNQ
jgi:MYXO-CTERM domain-containing protein